MTKVDDILKDSFVRSVCRAPRRVKRKDGTVVLIRCESASPRICPSCARLRQVDQMRLIGSGCNTSERDGITAGQLGGFTFWFVTLTAPSFGPVHRVPKWDGAPLKRCKCGQVHKHGDEAKGVPVNPRTYRYKQQVAWNAAVSMLTKRTLDHLGEQIPGSEYAVVKEWQTRGVIHLHAVVRVPVAYSETGVYASLLSLKGVTADGARWGKEADVRRIGSGQTGNSVRYMSKVVAYTSKQQGDSEGVLPELRSRHYDRLDWHAQRIRCTRRGCDSRTCSGKRHREFGYSGHTFTMSAGWSFVGLTRTALIEQRKAYATEQSAKVKQATLTLAAQYRADAVRDGLKPLDGHENRVDEGWRSTLVGAFLAQSDADDEGHELPGQTHEDAPVRSV